MMQALVICMYITMPTVLDRQVVLGCYFMLCVCVIDFSLVDSYYSPVMVLVPVHLVMMIMGEAQRTVCHTSTPTVQKALTGHKTEAVCQPQNGRPTVLQR